MNRKAKAAPWLAAAMILPLASGGMAGAAGSTEGGANAPATAPPAVFTVNAGSAGAHFTAPGQIEAVRQAVLAAQAGGRISEVLVRSGETVRKGQVLLRIDAPVASAAARAGRAQAEADAAQLATARQDFARTEQLHARQYVSNADLQRAAAQLRAVEAQATASAAQARAAEAAAGWQSLLAPYDGRVTSVQVAAGDLAQPGQALLGIYSPGPMRVLAEVPESMSEQLATGLPAHLDYPAGACSGAPTELPHWTLVPAIDPRSRSVGVRIELPEPRGCLPGVLVRVALPLKGASTTLMVPRSALLHRGEVEAVYVMDDSGRVGLRQVRSGEGDKEMVEILSGLESGERVVRDALRYRPAAFGRDADP